MKNLPATEEPDDNIHFSTMPCTASSRTYSSVESRRRSERSVAPVKSADPPATPQCPDGAHPQLVPKSHRIGHPGRGEQPPRGTDPLHTGPFLRFGVHGVHGAVLERSHGHNPDRSGVVVHGRVFELREQPLLTGTIPSQLGTSPGLLFLQLINTGLGGTVSSEVCSLVGPTDVTYNTITGLQLMVACDDVLCSCYCWCREDQFKEDDQSDDDRA